MEGIAGIISELHHLDQNITLAINSWHSPLSDAVWMFFSNREIWIPFYLLLTVLLFVRLGWKKGLIVFLSVVLTVAACDQFSNLLKNSVGRLRPVWDNYMLQGGLRRLEGRGNFYGFFSAHAANSIGVAMAVVKGFRNGDKSRSYNTLAWIMFVWAALVGISRIFVGKHFLGDVIVGFSVGLLFGWIFARIAGWIIDKYSLHL